MTSVGSFISVGPCSSSSEGLDERPRDRELLRSRDGGEGCVPSNNTPPVELPTIQAIPEVGNDEQGVGQEEEQNLSQSMQDEEERQPAYQQADDSQGDASSFLIATGGQERETSRSIPEVEDVAVGGHWLSAHERQPVDQQQANDDQGDGMNHPMVLAGHARQISGPFPGMTETVGLNTRQRPVYQQSEVGRSNDLNHSLPNREVVFREESFSIQQFRSDLRSVQANTLNYPTQEMGLEGLQRRDRQEVRHPIQETGPSAERTPDQHEDLPPCHHQLNGADINGVSSTGQTEEAVEHNCSHQELQLWKQELDRTKPQKATRNKLNPRETFFILEITEVPQRRQGDIAFFSPAIYKDKYEYKLGIRVYLNGVENENGRYVAIFVNIMMGKFDNIDVRWPFTQRITLSILDQSGAKRHISQSMQAKPNLRAFQKPTEAISCTGCGFVKFASIEEVFGPRDQYVKDDKLFLKVEFCG